MPNRVFNSRVVSSSCRTTRRRCGVVSGERVRRSAPTSCTHVGAAAAGAARRRSACPQPPATTASAVATINRVRFPIVLFDLDGTVIDSGRIILASMRHATQTVLEREFSDDELMASVGGPGLEAQMSEFAPDRVDELVRVYREHNTPLHDTLE